MSTRIGFVGLGVMGAPMAGHLAKAGYPLTVFDIDSGKIDAVLAAHPDARRASNLAQLASDTDVVLTMLPSGQYVREAALAEGGLVNGFDGGELLVDTSSSEPWITREIAAVLAARDVRMVDAPVSGAQAGAEAAELIFMVGGDEESVAAARPLLELMGRQSFHLGPIGAGHSMKSINNLITAMTFLATAEGLALGTRLGLDPDVMTDVLNTSTGMSWISRTHIKQRITNRAFDDAFKLELMVKDIRIALELADGESLPMPLSAAGRALWQRADEAAGPGASVSELVRWVERQAGVAIASCSRKPGR